MLGQFRDKWHNCITGSNQEHCGDYDYDYDEDTNHKSVHNYHDVFDIRKLVEVNKFRGAE